MDNKHSWHVLMNVRKCSLKWLPPCLPRCWPKQFWHARSNSFRRLRLLADRNNLSVGDKITFQEFETGKTECTFTIVGIYSGTEGTTKQAITPDGIPANCGYIDMEGLKKFYSRGNEKLEGYDNLDIYTHSPEEAKELMETIKDLPEVKGKTFTFDVNTEDFDMVSTPLSSFGSMVDTAVLTITVIGMLIIVLFLVLWTRSRNKEIAILLAVGRSKVEIIE